MGRMKFDDSLEKPDFSKAMLLRIYRYFLPYWKQTLVVLAILILTSLLGLLPPLLIQQIVDHALPGKDLRLLVFLVTASLGATVASGLLGVLQSYLNSFISQNIVYDMKNQMYRHLQGMPLQFFSNVKQGEVITRMTSDISGIQGVFSGTIVNFASNLLVLISTAVTLFLMNWKLALVSVLVVPLFVAPTRKMGSVRWKLAKQTQEKISEQNHIIEETLSLSGYMLMKLFTREDTEQSRFREVSLATTRLQIRESMAGRWFMMLVSTFASIGPMLIYLYGGYLFIQGEITVGAIIAFVALLGRLYSPVGQLTNLYVDIKRSVALFERIFDYFDMEPQIVDSPHAVSLNEANSGIEFQNVSFAYQQGKAALRDISFKAGPGTMTALVGPSGAGKTTITNLIPRLYDTDSGSIRIGSADITSLTLKSLRSNIGLVTQDTYLFNGTIRENLLYAVGEADENKMVEACKAAYIHDFIMELPDGYDTVVGNRGIKLSGGEKQRISIARVLLKNPSIIIMDEATSSLDTVSEFYVQEAMAVLLKNKTSLVIAHRLSTILAADNILVVSEGKIVEEGKHEQLLEKNGVYKDLYDKQFGKKAFA
ncbi:ATP-binding cassette, subfamily B [Paenibacillus sophorae]|uniref:ABC transporter ATP-binding protein/permease n=2 Tax=Paenibacillus sophorae TaxID=1333845 RepID=A0A1H8ULS3_9BACL|nr:ABC transporter ATP-binding protein [Paenibacillus sophorae]QWU13286.1 ABC transporter ATP-binding protein/permease [Paenibacillus sophorae]SEP03824.1 ATP-binding cassette, subfamily B [Paenibacillus sophorae]